MAQRHFYLGVENVALNVSQRQMFIDELKTLGPISNPQPARLNHWRIRLDSEGAIFEALFNEDNLTVTRFKQWLATIFNVDPVTIGHITQTKSYSSGMTLVMIFSRGGKDYLRFALFGGLAADWQQSGDECRGYLTLNLAEWELS